MAYFKMSKVHLKAEPPVLPNVLPKLTIYFMSSNIDKLLSQTHQIRKKKRTPLLSDYKSTILTS